MHAASEPTPLTQAEIDKRVRDYARMGFERRLPAQVVYHDSDAVCPWPGCTQYIDGIDFHLERWLPPDELEPALKSWWTGPGLVGACPGCGKSVRFGLTSKMAVSQPGAVVYVLPDDWHLHAYIVS